MRRPTLADVGAVAGVSAKTVSNVMLGRREVSEATRLAVLAAVAEVGYEVNLAGRGLVSGQTGRIAVVVPNVYQPYFAELAERLILALEPHGYTTMLRIANGGAAELDAVLGAAVSNVDGVIYCPHFRPDHDGSLQPRRPVVQLGGAPTPHWDCVVMGEFAGAEAMTRHLLESGRRRIALVWNSSPGDKPGGDRFEGHLAALRAHGVERDDALFVAGSDWDRRASGYEAMVGLLRSGASFDAALCVNDAIAVGALRALRRHGLRVPQDVAVTGFDNTDEGEFTVPSLSSVSPRQEEMVEHAVAMLLDRIAGDAVPPREVHTGADLVLRASSRLQPS
ncbi:LacI family DNA-binding transcriptional regulator [Cellulomonas sp. Leaf395]|uniref:LacI family DNA-binding transcriptional regulator n=1 Tax=Cellulomonas sp. Leaf395 TaxID=1736362 RepID=UPI000701F081|nr:LacI family DNA-binding transcriptional regulator [Cellulomonas sp. Leaf395]KQT01071.1 LacI family transcriptional regulator [Cellulomonas sp. Leaf395]